MTVVEQPQALAVKCGAMLCVGPTSVVLVGGFNVATQANTAALWLSTDSGRSWTALPDAPWTPRNSFGACVTADGHIVVAGGWSGNPDQYEGDSMADVWVLKVDDLRRADVAARWVCANRRAPWGPRSGLTLAATHGGAVLLVGGWTSTRMNDVWTLDVSRAVGGHGAEASWTKVATAPFAPRYGHAAAGRSGGGGEVVVIGGSTSDTPGVADTDAWVTGNGGVSWRKLAPTSPGGAPYLRYQCGAALLPGPATAPLRLVAASRSQAPHPYIHATIDSAQSWHGFSVPIEQFAAAAAVHTASLDGRVLVHTVSAVTGRAAVLIVSLLL